MFGEEKRAASKKPALREGFAAQGWLFGVFGGSFGQFYRPVLSKVVDFLALRKDLTIGIMNRR